MNSLLKVSIFHEQQKALGLLTVGKKNPMIDLCGYRWCLFCANGGNQCQTLWVKCEIPVPQSSIIRTNPAQTRGNLFKSTPKYPKVPNSTQKYPKEPKSTQNYQKVPKGDNNYQRKLRSTKKYQEVPRSTKK